MLFIWTPHPTFTKRMTEKLFTYENTTLHYGVTGTGPEVLLLFHGFGQDHTAFEAFDKILSPRYTLYAFDLYFHGRSTWGIGESPLLKNYWKKIMEAFLETLPVKTFMIAGFSLGGKFALATLEAFPERTKGIVLMAPDGIKTSFWYSLATYPLFFRWLFKSMILYPGTFLALSRMLYTLGVMDKGLIRFAERQMNTREKREQVYYSWVVFRQLRFELKDIASLINEHQVPLTLFVGKYDKVIRPENMNRLLKHLKQYRFEVLDSGHNTIIRESLTHWTAKEE